MGAGAREVLPEVGYYHDPAYPESGGEEHSLGQVFTRQIGRHQGQVEGMEERFMRTTDELGRFLLAEEGPVLCLLPAADYYLAQQRFFEATAEAKIFPPVIRGTVSDDAAAVELEFVLIMRRQEASYTTGKLEALRGAQTEIAVDRAGCGGMADMWLHQLMVEKAGHKPPALTTATSSLHAILAVYFQEKKACLVSRRAWNEAVGQNKRLEAEMEVVLPERSDSLAGLVLVSAGMSQVTWNQMSAPLFFSPEGVKVMFQQKTYRLHQLPTNNAPLRRTLALVNSPLWKAETRASERSLRTKSTGRGSRAWLTDKLPERRGR